MTKSAMSDRNSSIEGISICVPQRDRILRGDRGSKRWSGKIADFCHQLGSSLQTQIRQVGDGVYRGFFFCSAARRTRITAKHFLERTLMPRVYAGQSKLLTVAAWQCSTVPAGVKRWK
jgi:hypothetical protein